MLLRTGTGEEDSPEWGILSTFPPGHTAKVSTGKKKEREKRGQGRDRKERK